MALILLSYSVRRLSCSLSSNQRRLRLGKCSSFFDVSSLGYLLSASFQTSKHSKEEMKDEYGSLDDTGKKFRVENFRLDCGEILPSAQACYNTYGSMNASRDNVIVVCHALTGNASLDQWWGEMLGPGLVFDTNRYLIVCANVLGSCYGSSGPQSINPSTGTRYGASFPQVTIRDSVRLHMQMVKQELGASSVRCVVGGSMGGMQALEWAIMGSEHYKSMKIETGLSHDGLEERALDSSQFSHYDPPNFTPASGRESTRRADGGLGFVRSAVVIGCGARHSAWQIAISEAQRQAIYADIKWKNGCFDPRDPPQQGLSVARQIAMISYRSALSYDTKFGREKDLKTGSFQVENYLRHQGLKFLSRFDALTYIRLTQKMDSHDIGRDRVDSSLDGLDSNKALQNISTRMLIMGMDTDVLYPLYEQQELAKMIPGSTFRVIKTTNGHDGFLLEQDQVASAIYEFLGSESA